MHKYFELEKDVFDRMELIYIEKGMVTRKDESSISIRPVGRKSQYEMKKRGHLEAIYIEIYKPHDSTGILFNSDIFGYEFAYEYLEKYILKKENNSCLKLIQLEIF